jgi:hypothetical protein
LFIAEIHPIATEPMVLKDHRVWRSLEPRPEIPVRPHGFGGKVHEGNAVRNMLFPKTVLSL